MKRISILFIIIILTMLAAIILSCAPGSTVPEKGIKTTPEPNKTAAQSGFSVRARGESIPADAVKIVPELDKYPPKLHSDAFNAPVSLPGLVNTTGAEDSPFVLPDGRTFYFFFTPDVRIPVEKQVIDGVTGIYKSTRRDDSNWSEAERVILNNDISLDGAEFVQGNVMWFASARQGYTGVNWFTAELVNDRWQNWIYSGDQFPASYEVGELHITADGQELYFHSARAGGKGGTDIWVTCKADGKWQEPENVQPLNTADNEGMPCITPDGNELWFNRTYLGTPAVFMSKKINGQWSNPDLIVSQFAGEPSLDSAGNLYFVHHFYRDNVMLEADIYFAGRK